MVLGRSPISRQHELKPSGCCALHRLEHWSSNIGYHSYFISRYPESLLHRIGKVLGYGHHFMNTRVIEPIIYSQSFTFHTLGLQLCQTQVVKRVMLGYYDREVKLA